MASSHSKSRDNFLIIESLLELALLKFDTDHESARYGLSRALTLFRNLKKSIFVGEKNERIDVDPGDDCNR